MARCNQANGKLIVLAIIIAPIVWLHDKIGPAGIIILAVVIITIAILATQKRKTAKSTTTKPGGKGRRAAKEPSDITDNVLAALDRMDMTDYLGKAAAAGQKAKDAAAAGEFDSAWKHYHEQKALYIKHANRSGFTPSQVIALDGSVHRNLANLLRLENRHGEALVHFLYYFATSPKRTKTDEKQIGAYVNRAKLRTDIHDVQAFVATLGTKPDFRAIQSACERWTKAG